MAENTVDMPLLQYDPMAAAINAENLRAQRMRNRITQMQLDSAEENKSQQSLYNQNPQAFMPSFAGGPQQNSQLAVQPVPQQSPLAGGPQTTPTNSQNMGLMAPNLNPNAQGGSNPLVASSLTQQPLNGPTQANEGEGNTEETQGDFKDKIDKAQSVALGNKKLNSMGNIFMQAVKNNDVATADQLGKFVENDQNIQDLFEQGNFNMTVEKDKDTGDPLMGMTANWPKKSLAEMSQWKGGTSLANLPDGARVKLVFDPVKHEVTKIGTAPAEKGSEGILTDKQMSSYIELLYASKYGKTPEIRSAAKDLYRTRQENKEKEVKATSEARAEGSAEAKKRTLGLNGTSFASWKPDEKIFMYNREIETGEKPKFAFGDRESYTAYQQGLARYAIDNKLTPADVGTTTEIYKGLAKSQANQQKTIGTINAFVKNMGYQKDRLDLQDKVNAVQRTDYRLLNLPIRQALMTIKGSPQESILTMYLTDISNDMAKLSTGSSASVREISPEAQERWAKVHDPNLSIADRHAVVEETWKAAQGRIQTAQDALKETQQQMRDLGKLTYGKGEEEPKKPEEPANKKWVDELPLPKDNPKVHKGSTAHDHRGNKYVFDGERWVKQ